MADDSREIEFLEAANEVLGNAFELRSALKPLRAGGAFRVDPIWAAAEPLLSQLIASLARTADLLPDAPDEATPVVDWLRRLGGDVRKCRDAIERFCGNGARAIFNENVFDNVDLPYPDEDDVRKVVARLYKRATDPLARFDNLHSVQRVPEIAIPAGASRADIYEFLLCQFQEAHARLKRQTFILKVFEREYLDAIQSWHPKDILYRDSGVLVPRRLTLWPPNTIDADGFDIVAYDCDGTGAADWTKFAALGKLAGTYLPKAIRRASTWEERNPLTIWLNFFFWANWDKVQMEKAYGGDTMLSYVPFLDAADAIEMCGLTTSTPTLPPVLQAEQDRINAIPKKPSHPPEAAGQKRLAKPTRGRRSDTDHAEDQRVYDAWHTGSHKTYLDLAKARGKGEKRQDIQKAVERHAKRLKRAAEADSAPEK